ncbi:hypothetical protein B9Z19DRAFT_1071753 [Tuber borchii]|uniref:Uncharacterized protein n=1 Tax=Tuber borchii TaxID=42251 RepID=A0A2T7A7W4_TUBBO|nr:hypothetical protein B9Z19DRAFT_1071753 [Tuber borchii]
MQAPTPSLRSLIGYIDGNELRELLHPFSWVPLYLVSLGITIVETAQLFTPFIFFENPVYQDLIEGILHPEGLGDWADARIRSIRFIARISFRSWVDDPRENVEKFIDLVLGYLTKYVLQGTAETIIRSYRR